MIKTETSTTDPSANGSSHESAANAPEGGNSRTVISGASARRAACWMDYGNIIAILIPIPLLVFWFGASILVFAINRHHPNPKVGYYTQWAAYRFYGVIGFFVVVATFFPGQEWVYYLISWAVAALVIIPWSLYDIWRIRQDHWEDVVYWTNKSHEPGHL